MIHKVWTLIRQDFDATPVCIEVQCRKGIPSWDMVGLAGRSIKESRERIISALLENNIDVRPFKWTFNFSPANITKDGSCFDLAIAIGMLMSIGAYQPSFEVAETIILGEFSLDGQILKTPNLICFTQFLAQSTFKNIVLPRSQASEIIPVKGCNFFLLNHISELNSLKTTDQMNSILPGNLQKIEQKSHKIIPNQGYKSQVDWGDFSLFIEKLWSNPLVQNTQWEVFAKQTNLRLVLQLAVKFHLSLMVVGPPGCGKTHLVRLIHALRKPLSQRDWVENQVIQELLGKKPSPRTQVPLEIPHPSITPQAFIGGGRPFRPGAISLAHRGVLILDEALEYPSSFFESIRTCMESGVLEFHRVGVCLQIPTQSQYLFTSNPCPCGNYGYKECLCNIKQIQNYQRKISKALLERIDLHYTYPKHDIGACFSKVNQQKNKDEFIKILEEIYLNGDSVKDFGINSNENKTRQKLKLLQDEIDIISQKYPKIFESKSLREITKIHELTAKIAILMKKSTINVADLSIALQFRQNYLDSVN